MPKILIVDDEIVIAAQLEEHLTFMGYDVVGSASSGEEAIDMARELTPDIILMDIVMQPGGLDGIDAAKVIQTEMDIPVIFLTAFADDTYVERARNVQPFGYILKPFQEREIKACIEIALHKKGIERQLQESEERHRSVVETAGEAIIIVDHCGSIVSWNHTAETIFGYASAEVAGQPFTRMIPEGLRGKLEHEMHQIVATGKSAMFEKTLECSGLKKDGSVFPIEFSLTTWQANEKTFCTIIAADITEHKRIEEALAAERASLAKGIKERTAELSKANAELLHAVRLKDDFLASMSHEFRTPLNVILGMAQILQENRYGSLTDQQLNYLRQIEESGQRLLALLTNMLNLSQMETGELKLHMTFVPVESIYQAGLQHLNQAARKKQLKISFLCDSAATTIHVDEHRIKQVLVELFNNAVKFTPKGGTVGLDVEGDAEKRVVSFSVWDTGIGIAKEDLERLFQPFVHLDSSLSRGYEGAGIGLSLAHHIVDKHSGTISVESEVGKGSRFTVSLPWKESDSSDADHLLRKP